MSPINISILISATVSFAPSLLALVHFFKELYRCNTKLSEKNKAVTIKGNKDSIILNTQSPNALTAKDNDIYKDIYKIETIQKKLSNPTVENNNELPENKIKSMHTE